MNKFLRTGRLLVCKYKFSGLGNDRGRCSPQCQWQQCASYFRLYNMNITSFTLDICCDRKNAHYGNIIRECSNASRSQKPPALMSFPEIIWPSLFKTVKNWILVTFVIQPYLDSDFCINDFTNGAKQALQVISSKLCRGDMASLKDLVSNEVADQVKSVVHNMPLSQRQLLDVNKEDVYLSFPYQIGIMFDDQSEKAHKRWVEITMVFHILRGFKDMRERGVEIPWNMGTLPEFRDRVFVCNYRFIKEYTQGSESDWTVNVINHFRPVDLIHN